MAVIIPISDLRNYNQVLEKVSVGSPVYLTKNGHGKSFTSNFTYRKDKLS